jgi:hypothetical protein
MLRRLTVLAVLLLCSVGVLSAGAGADSTLNLVYDCGPLTGESCFPEVGGQRDMLGPSAGWVTARQRSNGDLQINVQVRGGDASANYQVLVYCGPAHLNADGLALISSLSTDAAGRGGNTNLVVPAANIAAACGPGSHTGHIDLNTFGEFGDLVSTLAASPLNFTRPSQSGFAQ